ncbi:hypothetical protein ANCCEY_11267 [Ancylostoma ceylanicum]|uniref:7TM GPCR serpentine receptor class x (Srx) domain-containing protein n=1 Tax=Ancylostoma ceylanicum TaxID=53326 RepID=A0A0D6LPQ4_9BILA|nr:hypothetical protein ANCCEY_11267 [Ancylostoma ceylanicum]
MAFAVFEDSSYHNVGTTNYPFGAASFIVGFGGEIVYALDLMIMIKKKYRSLSYYKIMIALGICDMSAIFLICIMNGYFWMVGATYCTNPNLMYVTGAMANGFFAGSCMNTFVLLLNRLLELRNKPLMLKIFKGGRTYAVLLIPLTYFLYFTLFTQPAIFNSDNAGWFFYTFVPHHKPEDVLDFSSLKFSPMSMYVFVFQFQYYNYSHMVNNMFVMTIIGSVSMVYYRSVLRLSAMGNGLSRVTQKSLFIQCAIVWLFNIIMSLTHIYIQFFHDPICIAFIAHVGWQIGHMCPAFIYLLFNSALQREVLLLFFRGNRDIADRSHPITTRTFLT